MVMALPSVSQVSMDVQVLTGESGAELAKMRVLWSNTPWSLVRRVKVGGKQLPCFQEPCL